MKTSEEKRSVWNNRIIWVVLSLLLSLCLWSYVTTVEGTAEEKTLRGIKVVLEGEENLREAKGLIITEIQDPSVTLVVSTNLSTRAKLNAADMTVSVDVSKVGGTGQIAWAYTINWPSGVSENNVTILERSVDVISFTVDRLSTKTVPVDGVFDGSPAEGYIAGDLEFSPAVITLSGPAEELDGIDSAWVVVDRESVSSTLEFDSDFTLLAADGTPADYAGVELDTDTVQVTLPIRGWKEVPVTVNLVAGGGAESADVVSSINPSTIRIAGDTEQLDTINKITLGTIDLASFASSYEETFPIVLDNGVENLSGDTQATVILAVKGLDTKVVTVTDISAIHVTEGYTATILTGSLKVTLRGPASELAGITADNVRAVADLTDLGSATGGYYWNLDIYVNGSTEVGVIYENDAEYTALVNVTEGTEAREE